MKAIDRKLWRDLVATRGQALAICLVIACGLATFVMSLATLDALKRSRDHYYSNYRFADVFCSLKRAPRTLLPRIEAIPGVARAQASVVTGVTLHVEGFPEPVTGQLVSLPERRTPILNDLHLRSGRWIERDRGEAIVSEAFAKAHGLQLGDSVSAILYGKYQELRLVGIAISPEYIYQVPPGALFPDDKRFGVLWVGYEELAAAFDMEEAFNNLALTLLPEANEPEVIRQLDRLIEPYGGLGAYGREHQVSSRFLDEEIKQLQGMALITPTIFLGVAAFLLHIVLHRLISSQREQIAALKAFGYGNREVGWHYLFFALVIVSVGTVLGIWAGNLLGKAMAGLYGDFYRFPSIDYRLPMPTVGMSLLVSALAGGFAVFHAVRRAATLPPAEAMRPEPPLRFHVSVTERMGLRTWLSPSSRMVLRQLGRRPFKALLSVVGIALSVSVLVIGNFGEDAIDYLMDFQMNQTQRQDITVTFAEPRNTSALQELERMPGVLQVEGFRNTPCRLRVGHREYLLAITGLPPSIQLARILQTDGTPLAPPESDGLVLSAKLAEILEVDPGDPIDVEVLEGPRPSFSTRLAHTIEDYTGLAAYMNQAALHRYLQETRTVSGAHLQIDSQFENSLYRAFKEIPAIAGVSIQSAAKQSFEETFGENMMRMRAFNVMFACIIAFGVIYNNARIALAERQRELATLRVIGFRRLEIAGMLISEMTLLTLLAIPLGWMLGKGFALLLVASAGTEFFRIPAVIDRGTYTFATLVTLIATALSCIVILRHVKRLDMIEALKCRE